MFAPLFGSLPQNNLLNPDRTGISFAAFCQNYMINLSVIKHHLLLFQMNPNQPECLILRGTCLVGLQDFSAALSDANAVIQMGGGQNAKTFLVKGDALYHLGEFEHALVHYHRALQRYFKITEAIFSN